MRPSSAKAFREPAACATRRGMGIRFTVTVELADATWTEFYAHNEDNARRMAEMSVRLLGARGATCWDVTIIGTLARRPFYEFYAGLHDEDSVVSVNRRNGSPEQ